MSDEFNSDNYVISDMLSLAGVKVPMSKIGKWSMANKRAVCRWAGNSHLSASDNCIRKVAVPAILKLYIKTKGCDVTLFPITSPKCCCVCDVNRGCTFRYCDGKFFIHEKHRRNKECPLIDTFIPFMQRLSLSDRAKFKKGMAKLKKRFQKQIKESEDGK